MTDALQNPCCRSRGSLVGPVLLTVAGVLLLLSELDLVSFHTTWPLLLIVGGVMVLLRRAGIGNGQSNSEVNHV